MVEGMTLAPPALGREGKASMTDIEELAGRIRGEAKRSRELVIMKPHEIGSVVTVGDLYQEWLRGNGGVNLPREAVGLLVERGHLVQVDQCAYELTARGASE